MQETLLTALETTKRQLKLVSLAAVAAAWTAATILLLLAFVLWDHWRGGGVPSWAGTSLRVVYLIGTIVWLTAAVILPLVRHISDIYAARLIERGHPEFGNALVSAVQLARREELPGSVRVAIVDQASRQVGDTDPRRSVPRGALRAWSILLVAAVVSFAGYSSVAPKSVMVSVRRAFGAHLPPPTRTVVRSVEPADGLRVLRGQAVPFRVMLAGRSPGEVMVSFSPDGGRTWPAAQQMKLMHMGNDGAWWGTRAGEDVQVTTIWRVTAGDGRSDLRRLIVVPEPAIIDMRVSYAYPPYTGLPPATQPGGDMDALAGTRATFEARTNVPVMQPVLIIGEGDREQRRAPSRPGSARASHTLTAEILVTQDDTYRLQFRDEDGHANTPVRYRILAQPDQLPIVDWLESVERIEVSDSEKIPIEGRAQDDFGLTRAVLAWRADGDRMIRERPLMLRRAGNAEYPLTHEVTAAELGLAPGGSADVWLSVWDNREDHQGRPAYQRADTAIRRLAVSRPPASAPVLARRDEPRRRPEPVAALEKPPVHEPTDQPSEPSQPSEAREPEQKPILQEFVNEHEKELALLEAKLAEELKDEPGGRVKSTLPNLVPDPAARSAPNDSLLSAEEPASGNPPGAPSRAEPSSDGQPHQAAASRPAEAGREARRGARPTPIDDDPDDPAEMPNAGQAVASSDQPSDPDESAPSDRPNRLESSNAVNPGVRTPSRPQEDAEATASPPPAQNQSGQSDQALQNRERRPGDAGGREEGSPAGRQNPGTEEASPDRSDADEASGSEQSDGSGPGECKNCNSPSGSDRASEQGAGQGNAGRQGAESGGEGNDRTSSTAQPGEMPGNEPGQGQAASDNPSDRPPEPGEAGPGSPHTGTGATEGGVSRSLPSTTQPLDDVAPLEPPAEAIPQLQSGGRVDKLVDTLERELRSNSVDPKLLQELGWNVERAQQFVEQYKRARERAQRQQERSELPDHRRSTVNRGPAPTVLQGNAGAPRAFESDARTAADHLPGVVDPARQRIPARYRPLLEAYYRSISTQPAR